MLWVLLAVLAHAGNAFVFVIDKSLLGSEGKIGQPARYAAYSGLVAGGAFVLLFFAYASPTPFIVGWSLLLGVFWVVALWLFFISLKHGEASRVVPIIGSAVPLFTLLFAVSICWQFLCLRPLFSKPCLEIVVLCFHFFTKSRQL